MKKIFLILLIYLTYFKAYSQLNIVDSSSHLGQRIIGTRPLSLIGLSPSLFIGKRIDSDSFNQKTQKYRLYDFQYNVGLILMARIFDNIDDETDINNPFSSTFRYSYLKTKKKKKSIQFNEYQLGISTHYANFKEFGSNHFEPVFIFPFNFTYLFGNITNKERNVNQFGAGIGATVYAYHYKNNTSLLIDDVPLLFFNFTLVYRIGVKVNPTNFKINNLL